MENLCLVWVNLYLLAGLILTVMGWVGDEFELNITYLLLFFMGWPLLIILMLQMFSVDDMVKLIKSKPYQFIKFNLIGWCFLIIGLSIIY